MLSKLRSLVNAILGKVPGKPDRLDTATRMAMDADFTAKPKVEPKGNSQWDEREAPEVDPTEELRRMVDSPAGSHHVHPPQGIGDERNAALISGGSRLDDEVLTGLTSPQRFREANGPEWSTYAKDLMILDGVWRDRRFRNTSFGVVGPRPSWEDTIARGAVLFDLESWATLDDEQAPMIAPTHFFADGDALLGSIGRRSNDVRSFLFEPEAAGDRDRILSLLKRARGVSPRSIPIIGGDILAEMCDVPGIGRAFATRLLTLSRPDGFVVVNNKSAEWLHLATGLSMSGKRSYRHLLEWLNGQAWYRAAEPTEPLGRRLWRIRAALLDAFAYQPWR